MLSGLLFAAALSFATPAENDCTAAARIECRELMGLVFHSADSETGRAIRLIDGERWQVAPIAIARFGMTRVLITASASEAAGHPQAGTWSAYYFDATAPRLRRSFLDFRQSGSFGHPGGGKLITLDGDTRALLVEGGGTWQGHSCVWASVDVIGDQGPRALIAPVLVAFHAGGEPRSPDINGEWETLTAQSALLRYADGQTIRYAPAENGSLQPHRPTPREC